MRSAHKFLVLSAGIFLCAIGAFGQDDAPSAPSLGDIARQARLQKQKDAQATQPGKAGPGQNKDGQSAAGSATPATANSASGAPTPLPQIADAPGSTPANDGATPRTKHVVTNDEIPEHVGPTSTHPPDGQTQGTNVPTYYPAQATSAEQWKAAIQQLKNNIASTQESISQISASMQYAGGNCIANCEQWNLRQKQKQDQVEQMKQQLEQMQKSLENMQDAARKQGFGSSVYDP